MGYCNPRQLFASQNLVKCSKVNKTVGLWQIPPAHRPGHRDTDKCLCS